MNKELKYFIPSARYSPAFQLKRWDGTISFCDIGGRTYLNLIDRLLPIIIKAGYEVEINDARQAYDFSFETITENFHSESGKTWPAGHVNEGKPIVLRDYQVEIINGFLSNMQGIQVASTGSGKCLEKDTKIDIYIDEENPFYQFLLQKGNCS